MKESSDKPIFKPNKEFAKDARIKNMCEYEELYEWAKDD